MTNANVARFLGSMAGLQPTRCALKAPCGGGGGGLIRYAERTFSELALSSDRVASNLEQAGIGRSCRTLLMVRPGLPLIEICFALFKLGAVPVVIDPGMGLRGFLNCVRHTQPEALVGIPMAVAMSRIFRGTFSCLRSRVGVGKDWGTMIGGSRVTEFSVAETAADELAAILFTSGSTGPAKGVCYEHGMFDAQVRLIRDAYGIEPGEIDLPMLPIFALFNPALGMTTVVPQMNPSRPAAVDPRKIVQAIEQNGVTNSFGSPILWDRIAGYCEREGKTLPTLRRILMAGAPAPVRLLERMRRIMPDCEVHTPYGATECLPVATICAEQVLSDTWSQTLAGAGTCVGCAVPEVSIRILPLVDGNLERSSDDLESPLKSGEIGEIVVTGPSVTRAYDGLPGATRRSKVEASDGIVWHRMGDVGYLDEADRLWFCGRAAEYVETIDGRLFTDPVEAIFNQVEGVRRSALIGLGVRPHQIPAVVVERLPGVKVSEAALRHQASQFELTQGIERFFFARSFPVDVRHNAKINRLSLKRRFDHGGLP